jgi:MoaA/NifB/PqqE/SkfB family radical SAM enzyme/predicted SAM-dependent methyltransferase
MYNGSINEIDVNKIDHILNPANNNLSPTQEVEYLISKNELNSAEEKCYRLLNDNSKNIDALLFLGKIKLLQKNDFEAEMFFENVLQSCGSNLTALKNLAEINIEKNSLSIALNYFIELNLNYPGKIDFKKYIDFFAANLQGDQLSRFYNFMKFNEMVPTTFTIETALACDLKCPECAIGGGMISSRAKGYMKFEKFKEAFDKIKSNCEYLYLHLWGEPLLNKEIFEMIKYASQFTRTNISTNAQSLNKDKIEKLIASGVSEVIVSIDGFTQQVYEKYRVGGNVEKALESLNILAETNRLYDNKVNITPQFIVFRHNEHEVENFNNYCRQIGLTASFKSPYIRNENSIFSFSSNSNFHRKQYPNDNSLKNAMRDCVNPKEVFTINLDGSVIVCCHDYDKNTNFGNIFENDVTEIWNSYEYRKFRWNILDGEAPEFCLSNCMTYTNTKSKKSSEVNPIEHKKHDDEDINTSEKSIKLKRVNLCSGPRKLEGFVNIDITQNSDLIIDLEKTLLPFENESVETLICISAINYFSRDRALEIIKDVYRSLCNGGVARFAVQDLKILTAKYLSNDEKFFNEKLADGSDRFPGDTFADKFNEWFYGFPSLGKHCKYVYDFESLSFLFRKAGFRIVETKNYQESRIENIELIDNRPEQMFFLEAVKQIEITEEHKNDISGESFDWSLEKKWQQLLRLLDRNIGDRNSLLEASQLMINSGSWIQLVGMLQKYLAHNKHDNEIKELLNEALIQNQKSKLPREELLENHYESLKLNKITKSNKSDIYHLEKAIQWLDTAFQATGGRGVAAKYNLREKKWDVAYPETTGYIIPTLLEFSKLTKNDAIAKQAAQLADWEIAIQWEDGGIGEPVGVFGQKPRVFNTSQVMLGFTAMYDFNKDNKYLEAAIRSANWLVNCQEKTGEWINNTYRGARSYHIRTAWALLELNKIIQDERYYNSAINNLDYTLSLMGKNGFMNNTSLDIPEKPWTHLIAYTLVGLLEVYTLINDKNRKVEIISVLVNAAENLINYYNKNRDTQAYPCFPGTFDRNWESNDNWTCNTGNAQLEYFLRRMYNQTKYPQFLDCADKLNEELKNLQILDPANGNKNLYGSLTGSYPVEGKYCVFMIPNWGVKFFADSMIQKIFNSNKYLG